MSASNHDYISVTIRKVPDDLWRELKATAVRRGVTISELAMEAFRKIVPVVPVNPPAVSPNADTIAAMEAARRGELTKFHTFDELVDKSYSMPHGTYKEGVLTDDVDIRYTPVKLLPFPTPGLPDPVAELLSSCVAEKLDIFTGDPISAEVPVCGRPIGADRTPCEQVAGHKTAIGPICGRPIGSVVGQICRQPEGHSGKHDKPEKHNYAEKK